MKTILIAEFRHETNRYSPGLTDMENYKQRNAVFGEAAFYERFAGAKNEMTGFVDHFAGKEGYRIVPVLAMNAAPGAVVAQPVWELVKDKLLEAIDQTPQLDGILLCLHGAMVTERFEDGEGELLEVLRNRVGAGVPIMGTLDLHANITDKMIRNADALFGYDYYPHTDMYEAGLRAAACMQRTLDGEIKPVMASCKLDVVLPLLPTATKAYVPFLEQVQSSRNKGKIVDISICHGFFPSDIYDQGVAVLAVTDDDADLAQKTADQLGGQIFGKRAELRRSLLTAKEAVEIAKNSDSWPVVLADVADNPGSGGSSDSTEILRVMIEENIQDAAVAMICDPEVVIQAEKAGVGSTIQVQLGGKAAPEVTGGPISCTAYVKAITDGNYRNRDKMCQGLLVTSGKCALLQIGGIQVIVSSFRTQPWDLEAYRHCGIQPQDMKILVVKSATHFRASFGTVSNQILDVQVPALAPPCPEMLPLKHSRRPIYPMDNI